MTAAALLWLAACGGGSADGPDAGPPPDADITCEPVSQSGCDTEALKCAFVVDDVELREGHIACARNGPVDLGSSCSAPTEAGEADDCEAGGHCYNGACRQICEFGVTGCSDGTCARFANLPFDLCLETCDPLAQDCPDTAGGSPQGCYLTGTGAVCAAVFGGTGIPPGGACNFVNDCEKGAGCFGNNPGVCLAYCDIQQCPGTSCPAYCASGFTCQGIQGQPRVGACVP